MEKAVRKINLSYIDVLLILVALIWGINPAVMKIGLEYMSPLAYTVLRITMSTVCAWIVLLSTKGIRKIEFQDGIQMIWLSISYFAFQLLFIWGINQTSPSNASLINGLLPIIVVIINLVLGAEEISRYKFLAICFSFLGVCLILIGSEGSSSFAGPHIIGGMLLLVAQFAYAWYTVYSKKVLEKYPIMLLITIALTINSIVFLILDISDFRNIVWTELPPVVWASILFSGVLSMTLANYLWFWGVKKVGSTKTAVYYNLSPVFAIVVSWVLLDEPFGLLKIFGALLIIFSIYCSKDKSESIGKRKTVWVKGPSGL